MGPAARYTVAVVAGVVAAFTLVAGIESLGHAVYPVPAGIDFSNASQVQAYVQRLPVGARS